MYFVDCKLASLPSFTGGERLDMSTLINKYVWSLAKNFTDLCINLPYVTTYNNHVVVDKMGRSMDILNAMENKWDNKVRVIIALHWEGAF